MNVQDVLRSDEGTFAKVDGEWWHKLDGKWLVEATGTWADPVSAAQLDHELWTRSHKPYTDRMLAERVAARVRAEIARSDEQSGSFPTVTS